MGNILCCSNNNGMNQSGSNSHLAMAPYSNDSPTTRSQRMKNVRRLKHRPSGGVTSPALKKQDSAKELGFVSSSSPTGQSVLTPKRRLTYNEIDLDQYDIAFVL